MSNSIHQCILGKSPCVIIYYRTNRCMDYDKRYNETRKMHLCKWEEHETILAEMRSLSVTELMARTRIMQQQEFPAGTVLVCCGLKVFVERGACLKEALYVNYKTPESTTDSYPLRGCLYLPDYKLGSFSEKRYYLMRYNVHYMAKRGMKNACVKVLSIEKNTTLEALPNHSHNVWRCRKYASKGEKSLRVKQNKDVPKEGQKKRKQSVRLENRRQHHRVRL